MMKPYCLTILITLAVTFSAPIVGEENEEAPWLNSLQTDTPQAGFELAITLSRQTVKAMQGDMEMLRQGRAQYADDPAQLIEASQVVATHFQTIAEANNYWRD